MRLILMLLIFASFISYVYLCEANGVSLLGQGKPSDPALPFGLVSGIFTTTMALAYFFPWGKKSVLRSIETEPPWAINLGMILAPCAFTVLAIVVFINAHDNKEFSEYGIALASIICGFYISYRCYRAKGKNAR
jgi:hypothetical protein